MFTSLAMATAVSFESPVIIMMRTAERERERERKKGGGRGQRGGAGEGKGLYIWKGMESVSRGEEGRRHQGELGIS